MNNIVNETIINIINTTYLRNNNELNVVYGNITHTTMPNNNTKNETSMLIEIILLSFVPCYLFCIILCCCEK